MSNAVQFHNVSKFFFKKDPGVLDYIAILSRKIWRNSERDQAFDTYPSGQYFPALKAINFQLKKGESLGIIGMNGSGKSTLLGIAAGGIKPSEGRVEHSGSIGAILELGVGFNPEYTGRENAEMSASIHGVPLDRRKEYIQFIEDFAEIGDFFDQPVKRYSSGMGARLAFSVVASMRPEILIVDEVLSVGDSYFQHKSFQFIRRLREDRVTLLIASHAPETLRTLCDRGILLDRGNIIMDGEIHEVMDYYNEMISQKSRNVNAVTIRQTGDKGYGNKKAVIQQVEIVDGVGNSKSFYYCKEVVIVRVLCNIYSELGELTCGILIRDRLGNLIFGTNTFHLGKTLLNVVDGRVVKFDFRFSCNLGPGSYSVTAALHTAAEHVHENYNWIDNILTFEVIRPAEVANFIGPILLEPEVTIYEL